MGGRERRPPLVVPTLTEVIEPGPRQPPFAGAVPGATTDIAVHEGSEAPSEPTSVSPAPPDGPAVAPPADEVSADEVLTDAWFDAVTDRMMARLASRLEQRLDEALQAWWARHQTDCARAVRAAVQDGLADTLREVLRETLGTTRK